MTSRNSTWVRKAGWDGHGPTLVFVLPWLGVLALAPVLATETAPREPERKGRGFAYQHDEDPKIPLSIHVLKVERSRADFEVHSTLAKGATIGLGKMTEQTKALPPGLGKPIAAINGDFWKDGRYEGDPEGLQIMRGELISAPGERACFWIDTNGQPHATNVLSQLKVIWPNNTSTPIGLNEERADRAVVLYTSAVGPSTRTRRGRELILERAGQGDWLPLRPGCTLSARVREVRESGDSPVSSNTLVLSPGSQSSAPDLSTGAVVQISTAMTPDLRGVLTAVAGGPALVREGKVANFTAGPARHPRTAIGWNDKFYFFVVVDGRQPRLSLGISLQDLAAYMIKLGCEHALNLDGGGSTTFWIYGHVMNSPCYGYERPMANAVVLVQKPPNESAAVFQSSVVSDVAPRGASRSD